MFHKKYRITDDSCESKVTKLNNVMFCDQNVFRLYISVNALEKNDKRESSDYNLIIRREFYFDRPTLRL